MDVDPLKKPVINLQIESKNSNFLTDQTPTPTTRLIKNCEEVGLFDDLKHVNPFDETFRRAVEESTTNVKNKESNNTLTLPSSEDTLHTPHIIYDNIGNVKQTEVNNFELNKEHIILSKIPKKLDLDSESVQLISIKKTIKTSPKSTVNKKLRMLLPNNKPIDIKEIQNNIISVGFHGQIENGLEVNLNTISTSKDNNIETNYKKQIHKDPQEVKKKLKAVLTKCSERNAVISKDINKSEISKNPLERKRAASMRYRKKRNKEILELRKKNSELQSENILLKEKVKQLQHTLLTQHSNCNLTKKELQKNPNGTLAEMLLKATPTIHIPSSTILLNIPRIIMQQKGQVMETFSTN